MSVRFGVIASVGLLALGVMPWKAVAQETPPVQAEVPGPGAKVTCESQPGQRQVCNADASHGVALTAQAGDVACLLGKTWGYDDRSVWVADGCRGEFLLGSAEQTDEVDTFLGQFEPYGRIVAHVALFDGGAELQDNASWAGVKFSTGEAIKFFAGAELAVNLMRGETQFNAGATTSGGFLTLDEATQPVFGLRLGYVGVDFGHGGRFTLGKQHSVHYDIAGYTTDQLNVFGGQGSLAYPAGTDGGTLGTGRVDQAVTYRNRLFKIVEVGLQTQFRSASQGDFVDGVGASAQVTLLPGLTAGGSYTRTMFGDSLREGVQGLGGDAEYGALGVRFESQVLTLGGVFATQHNGDAVRIATASPLGLELTPVVFDGTGVELFGRGDFGVFSILGGFVDYEPDSTNALIDPGFRVRYAVLGAEWHIKENGYAYAEARLDDSRDASGANGYNVLTLGFCYNFGWKARHRAE